MNWHKKIFLLLFFISIAGSVFGKMTSRVTNNTNQTISVFWTAAGCAKIFHKIHEVCKHQHLKPQTTGTYVFKASQTDLQIKTNTVCKTNGNAKNYIITHNASDNIYSIFCPSGSWKISGWKSIFAGHPTCKLHGKGRRHVRNVIINDFNSQQEISNNCYYPNPANNSG